MLDALQNIVDSFETDKTLYAFVAVEVLLDNDLALRYTTLGADREFRGVNWRGAGNLLALNDLQETNDLAPEGAEVILSGMDEATVSFVLRENLQDRPLTIYFGLFDESGQIIDTPMELYRGFCDTAKIQVSDNQAVVSLASESHAARWSTPDGSVYNDADQQDKYPGDDFFKHGPQSADQVTTTKWPTADFWRK